MVNQTIVKDLYEGKWMKMIEGTNGDAWLTMLEICENRSTKAIEIYNSKKEMLKKTINDLKEGKIQLDFSKSNYNSEGMLLQVPYGCKVYDKDGSCKYI